METASIVIILVIGLIKLGAIIVLVRSLLKWCRHEFYPYRAIAQYSAMMFSLVGAHITFRLLCLFWQGTFGSILLFTDLISTPVVVMVAFHVRRAVMQAEDT